MTMGKNESSSVASDNKPSFLPLPQPRMSTQQPSFARSHLSHRHLIVNEEGRTQNHSQERSQPGQVSIKLVVAHFADPSAASGSSVVLGSTAAAAFALKMFHVLFICKELPGKLCSTTLFDLRTKIVVAACPLQSRAMTSRASSRQTHSSSPLSPATVSYSPSLSPSYPRSPFNDPGSVESQLFGVITTFHANNKSALNSAIWTIGNLSTFVSCTGTHLANCQPKSGPTCDIRFDSVCTAVPQWFEDITANEDE
jgi:hypothetical protein